MPKPHRSKLRSSSAGGVGTFAVQFAKMYGAEVTGVDNAKKLGVDHVIDYTHEDYTKKGQQYDFILDHVAYRSVFAYNRAVNSNGKYYMVGGPVGTIFQVLL